MHPLKTELHNELHARPSIYFSEPAYVFHLALVENGHDLKRLVDQLSGMGAGEEQQEGACGLLTLEGCSVKWERHTEFLTLTMVVPKPDGGESWPAIPERLRSLISGYEHALINATQVLVEAERNCKDPSVDYGFKDPAGSTIGGGDAVVWSDFRLSEDGMNRILLVNRGLNAYRLGRMVRRLLEIETYRMMASLTLPAAKAVHAEMKTCDQELTVLSEQNAVAASSEVRRILDDIATLSARIVRLTARYRLRFSAAEAYSQIVFERIAELRESHVGDSQRLGIFIERRFRPTVRYCAVTYQRLERLGDSVAHLGELLQARVQVEVEEQNSAILKSLNTRATAQIKIQKAVEGLSIIAISYYLLSLFKLLYEGLRSIGLQITPSQAGVYIVPIAVLIISAIAARIRKAKEEGSE
ncbi:DUF3422 domain-containing protein [Pseudomonas sp. 30_B]|uniref:DUF3422 domain-containing protein n=1 Tax=Pseudomonas sp. 30_B TaxID=2813575 RepID=UPI001A9E75C2